MKEIPKKDLETMSTDAFAINVLEFRGKIKQF